MIPAHTAATTSYYCNCCTACDASKCQWGRRYTIKSTADDRGNRGPPPPPGNRHERRRQAALERSCHDLSSLTERTKE